MRGKPYFLPSHLCAKRCQRDLMVGKEHVIYSKVAHADLIGSFKRSSYKIPREIILQRWKNLWDFFVFILYSKGRMRAPKIIWRCGIGYFEVEAFSFVMKWL